MKDKVKVYSKKALPWIAIIAFYSLLFVFGVGCPIKYATGVSCFGCGMTRAVWAAARLHFADAFYYHPLWVVLPVWAVLFIFRKKINKNVKEENNILKKAYYYAYLCKSLIAFSASKVSAMCNK